MKAIIFDFDGTVANTRAILLRLNKEIAAEAGREPFTEQEIAAVREMTYVQGMKYFKLPVRSIPKVGRMIMKSIKNHIDSLKPNKGIKTVLNELSKLDGLMIGLVSTNTRSNIYKFLDNHDLKDKFNFIATGVSVFGKQKKLKQVLKKYKLDAADCIYVGDEIRDIEATRKVPIRIIVVPWGFNTEKALKKNKPDWFIENASDITTIVKRELLNTTGTM